MELSAFAMTARIAVAGPSVAVISAAVGIGAVKAGRVLKNVANDGRVQRFLKEGDQACAKIMKNENGAKLIPLFRASITNFRSCRNWSDIYRELEKLRQNSHKWLDERWDAAVSGLDMDQREPLQQIEREAQIENVAEEEQKNLSFYQYIIKKLTKIWQKLCLLVNKFVELIGKILKIVYDIIIQCWEGIKTCVKQMYSAVADGMKWVVNKFRCWFGD